MSEAEDPNSGQTAADRLIREARIELQLARNQMLEEWASRGGVSTETKRTVAVATLKLRDCLHEVRDAEAIADEWADSDLQQLDQLLHETVTTEEKTPGSGSNTRRVERPAIVAAPVSYLDDLSREIKDFAKDLGKGPSVNEQTPRTEITDEMIDKVEEWRQANLE